jgi:hypothetical protein
MRKPVAFAVLLLAACHGKPNLATSYVALKQVRELVPAFASQRRQRRRAR